MANSGGFANNEYSPVHRWYLYCYRPHTKYREGYVFSVSVLLFTGGGGEGGGGGGGVKIEKCSECHGKPKKYIKIFLDYYSL